MPEKPQEHQTDRFKSLFPGEDSRRGMRQAHQERIERLQLGRFIQELDTNGYTVVPPSVTGLTGHDIDLLVDLLLRKSEALVGCAFSVEQGAENELDYGEYRGTLELQSNAKPSQFQLMQLCTYDRAFRDLAVNETAVSLMRHMIGPVDTRFSSHNCFIKWKGEGYGASLGLHCDQSQIPLPWGLNALTANCNWCLSEYTRENGAFACVPGSHLRHRPPVMPEAIEEAIPVECPRGSLIAFHGQLWHGAFPRANDGLRVTIANYYRHATILPQDDIPNSFNHELADDCRDPEQFKQLAGFGTPYRSQVLPVPRAVKQV